MDEHHNPYGLTLEGDLEAAYKGEIAAFWGAHAERCDFTGVDSVPIAAVKIVRPGSDVGVVISNGRTESFIKYKELGFDLWKQGFSVYILDHRGQGLSGRMSPDEHMGHVEDFADYVSDVKAFVDTIVKPQRHTRLAMLAHSMGGAIASLYLEQHHDDFDAAVLSSPMHEPNTGKISDDFACGALRALSWLGRTDRYAPGKGPYDETEGFSATDALTHSEIRWAKARDEYASQPKARLGGPSIGWVVQACEAGERARRDAGRITIPVLVIQAGADDVVTPEGQREFCARMNASRLGSCQFEVIPDAYHELFIENDRFRLPAVTKALDFIQANCR
jgi:lysophospholipase